MISLGRLFAVLVPSTQWHVPTFCILREFGTTGICRSGQAWEILMQIRLLRCRKASVIVSRGAPERVGWWSGEMQLQAGLRSDSNLTVSRAAPRDTERHEKGDHKAEPTYVLAMRHGAIRRKMNAG